MDVYTMIVLGECKAKAESYVVDQQDNYRPQMKFAKVMFLHVSVILSTGEST